MIGKAKDIYIIACGTALHAGMVGQYLFSQVNGLQAHFISAAEFPYFENLLSSKDLVITISQSGETADVMEAVRSTQRQGAKVLALVNVMGSSLMRAANFSIQTKAGPEICVLSTKAYSSQVATLFMLTYALENKIDTAREILKDTSMGLVKLLEKKNLAAIKQLAKEISKSSDIYLIGRGLNYPTALEAALKIKEVSYIHAEGFAGGDLKHGPIALIEKGTPAIVFVASDSSEKEILSNAMEIKARGGLIIGVGPKNNEVFDRFIQVDDIPEISPLSNIAPAQILSYYLALERGTDPDKPRNLAKSVTVK
jgi:glucosamine--fructose-6-phosphate aminotransferase (isomerizing)